MVLLRQVVWIQEQRIQTSKSSVKNHQFDKVTGGDRRASSAMSNMVAKTPHERTKMIWYMLEAILCESCQ
jgi:hypothetical protein